MKTSSLLARGIMKVVNLYKKRGFVIDICLMDNDFESVRGIYKNNKFNLIFVHQMNTYRR
jgi:hypothetical protein